MEFTQEFIALELDDLRREAALMKADAWRFVQTHCVACDDGIDIYYTFMKDGCLRNYRIAAVKEGTPVPSITDLFLAAFVFENEARELFGVNMGPIAIDFDGAMYNPPDASPMTFLTPEQKEARDKTRKAAAAKEAKGPGENAPGGPSIGAAPEGGRRRFVMTPELQARLDAKMPTLSPEKLAKVQAALQALEAQDADVPLSSEESRADAREAADDLAHPTPLEKAEDEAFKAACDAPDSACGELPFDKELAAKLDSMEPEKAERVSQALEGREPTQDAPGDPTDVDTANMIADEEMEELLSLMDADKAAKVIAAFGDKEGE